MAMFGDGGGGNFDPSNWVDMKVYHEVMDKNSGGGSFHHNHNKDNKNNKDNNLGIKILNIVAWVGFIIFVIIYSLVGSSYKYPDKIPYQLDIILALLPIIWLIVSYIVGFVILQHIKKSNNKIKDEDKK